MGEWPARELRDRSAFSVPCPFRRAHVYPRCHREERSDVVISLN